MRRYQGPDGLAAVAGPWAGVSPKRREPLKRTVAAADFLIKLRRVSRSRLDGGRLGFMVTDITPDLDIEQHDALQAYLRHTGRIGDAETIVARSLTGGVSNRVVLVERANGDRWVLKQALPKLRVQVDWFSSPARSHREALGLRWLEELAPLGTITPLVFEDVARHLLAMKAVPEPHENWKTRLLEGRVEDDHIAQFARLIAAIHRRGSDHRDQMSAIFADRSFFESLRVEPYYGYTSAQVPDTAGFYGALMADTRATSLTVVHGDFSPKNVLIHDGRLILLDHEVIHFGDPAFDLGFGLTHLLSKAHHVPSRRTDFARAAHSLWNSYSEALDDVPWQDVLEARVVRHALGCLLARVAGRSPLEYLSAEERARQRTAVVAVMHKPPATVRGLIDAFVTLLDADPGIHM